MSGTVKTLLLLPALVLFLTGCVGTPEVRWYDPEDSTAGQSSFRRGGVLVVPAAPERGFHTEYILVVPKSVATGRRRILVVPNNTGTVSDDHDVHFQRALRDATGGWARYLARELEQPLLIPVFDRLASMPTTYTHALDSDTMALTAGPLARVDLQLLAMVDHARKILFSAGIATEDDLLLFGFSAAGTFTNRFAALHPRRVHAAASGGVNGMPVLPVEELQGQVLPFHIGVGNLPGLTGKSFDHGAYSAIRQYIFMGALDTNDTLPYDDAYSEEERELSRHVLGNTMTERWERAQEVYRRQGVAAEFVTYPGTGHELNQEIMADVVEFFLTGRAEGPDHTVPD